jgi:hypothetical protein
VAVRLHGRLHRSFTICNDDFKGRKISAARIKYFLQGPCELQTQSLSFHICLFALQVLHQHTRRKSVREQQKAGFPHYHGFVLSDVFEVFVYLLTKNPCLCVHLNMS